MTISESIECAEIVSVIAILAFAFSGCGVSVGTPPGTSESYRAAIEKVFAEHDRLSRSLQEERFFLDKHWDDSALVTKYAGYLNAIDLSGCPIEFHHAHNDFAAAWYRLGRTKANNEGLNGMAKAFLKTGGSILTYFEDLEGVQNELDTTWRKLQQIATAGAGSHALALAPTTLPLEHDPRDLPVEPRHQGVALHAVALLTSSRVEG